MADILYEKYLNLQKFIIDYRKFQIKEPFLDQKTFKKNIHNDHYIKHNCIDQKNGNKLCIILFKKENKYTKSTPIFERLMSSFDKEKKIMYIISREPLSIYIKKSLSQFTNLTIINYLHKHFSMEIPKGPFCSKHTILSPNEVNILCSQQLLAHPLSLPSISLYDPQCIWIGAEIGDIIKIESLSELTGKAVRYRIVSPILTNLEQYEYKKRIKSKPLIEEDNDVDDVKSIKSKDDYELNLEDQEIDDNIDEDKI